MLQIWERAFKLIEEAHGNDQEIRRIVFSLGLADQIAPLHHASGLGRNFVVQSILKYGGNANAKNSLGLTPLHCASREGKIDVMRTLLDSDADVNAVNPDGGTSLHAASHWGKVNAVKFLLEENAMFVENSDGFSAMYYACKNGHVDVMEALIDAGSPMTARPGGLSCLHAAVSSLCTNAVDLLLRRGLFDINIPVDSKGYEWYTPLACAIDHGSPSIVQSLLKAGADVTKHKKEFRRCAVQSKNDQVLRLVNGAVNEAAKRAKLAEEELLRLFEGEANPSTKKSKKKKKKKKRKKKKVVLLTIESEETHAESEQTEIAEFEEMIPTADEEPVTDVLDPVTAALYEELDRKESLNDIDEEVGDQMSAEIMHFLDQMGPSFSQYVFQLATEFESISAIAESYQSLEYKIFAEDYGPMKRHHAKRIIQEAHRQKQNQDGAKVAPSIATHKSLTLRELKRIGGALTRYLVRCDPSVATEYGDLHSDLTLSQTIDHLYDCGVLSQNQYKCLHTLRKARNIGEHRSGEYLNCAQFHLSEEVQRALDFLGIDRKEVSRRREFHCEAPWTRYPSM